MKVICAEVECREMQDKGIAALRRQLVTKEILVWLGRDLKGDLGPGPRQEQGHFPPEQVLCV